MGKVIEINGPIVTIALPEVRTGEQVNIGTLGLIGEVIGREGEYAVVQMYEDTQALKPGETVRGLGYALSVELGPGLLGNIFDGVQRPLNTIAQQAGDFIPRGVWVPPLNRERKWAFTPEPDLQLGTALTSGMVLGTVQETQSLLHRIMVPSDTQGELLELAPAGDYAIDADIARVRDANGAELALSMLQRWPVRSPRPYLRRDHAVEPLLTGQRILDTFFPLLKGGKAAVPGPFGAGKTIVQQQIARWSNANVVIYVGCGERGNELVDILESFPKLSDPYTGRSLMERTVLVANTSNMPVVARESSIYVGATIAEYYRDQEDLANYHRASSESAEAL